jgi:hypothetical protein
MSAVMEELELSEDEIVRITRFRRPKKQLEFLTDMGIPAKLRRDNTVCVLRMHMRYPTQQAANDAPKRKSEKR